MDIVRICLDRIMKDFDVWDVEDLEELLQDSRDLTRDQEANLRSFLNLLQNKAVPRDRICIRRYHKEIVKICTRTAETTRIIYAGFRPRKRRRPFDQER